MSRDRAWLKCLVLFLLFADTLDCIVTFSYIYDSIILHFSKSILIIYYPKSYMNSTDDVNYIAKANWGVYHWLYLLPLTLTIIFSSL